MKKILLTALILLQTGVINSQINTDNISFEIRYPVSIGDNFINKFYNSIIDFGVDYNIIKTSNWGFGILLHSSFLSQKENDVNLYIISPKVKAEYNIKFEKVSITPQIGMGYSSFTYKAKNVVYRESAADIGTVTDATWHDNGFSYKASMKLMWNINKKINWYALIAYEFTRLKKPDEALDINFNRNIQILYPGIGITWNFNN